MGSVFQRNLAGTILHPVRNLAGTGTVTGQAGVLTYTLRDEAGNIATTGVTIAEQGSTGYYDLTFTPDNVGNWLLTVTDPAPPTSAGLVTAYAVQVVLAAAGNAPSGTFLTTLANLEEHLNVTGTNPAQLPEAYLSNVIARASLRIERIVGRPLVSASTTEYLTGGGRYLNLRRGPVTTFTSLHEVTYNSAGAESLTALTRNVDYFVHGDTTSAPDWILPGYVESWAGFWAYGPRNYRAIYTAGFVTVPYDLEQACLHACVAIVNKRKDAATGSRDIGGGAIGGFRSETELDDELRRMVARYVDGRVAV